MSGIVDASANTLKSSMNTSSSSPFPVNLGAFEELGMGIATVAMTAAVVVVVVEDEVCRIVNDRTGLDLDGV